MTPQVPIVKFVGPAKDDQALIELHDTTSAAYIPLDLGTPYDRTREFPGYRLGKQFNLPNDHKWMVRVWIKDEPDSTFWNWVEKFSGDANAYPIFVRTYREQRKTYAPLTKGLPLKSIYKLTLVTAGTGYTPGTLPALTFNNGGTGGTGAVGHALVNPDGTIAALVLDDGGDGYNTAPTFTIAAPPSGTTATGTAVIQPATALLVAEETQQYPEDSEFHADFLSVTRIFETLPGPTIPYTRFDDNLGPVQGYRQAVLWNNQAASLSATGKTTYEARDGSSIVAWKIVEAWSDGSGGAGNPAFPNQQWTEFERDGVKKVVTRQLTPIADIVFDETLAGGVLTRKYSERYNEFLAFQIIETITVDDADFLDQPAFTTSIPNVIPEIFRALIPTHVESHIIEGTAEETALTTGEFEHTERQLTPLYKEVRSTVLDDIGSLPITITGNKETNQNKQVVTVAMKLCIDSTTPTVPTALIDVDFKKLGNGLAIEVTRTIPAVFSAGRYEKSIRDVLPPEFAANFPVSVTAVTSAGTADTTPDLATGDLSKTEEQVAEFIKRVTTASRDTLTLPATLELHETTTEFGGGDLKTIVTIDDSEMTIDEGLLVVDSQAKPLGAGLYIKITKSLNDTAWPEQEGQNYDEELDAVIPFTQQVVDAGTSVGTPSTDVQPIDKWKERRRTIDGSAIEDALDAFVLSFPGTANLDLPDVLVSVTASIEKTQGDGDSDEDGSAGSTNSSSSLTLRATGQASAAIMPEVQVVIKETWARNIPTIHYFFYLPNPVTPADVLAKLAVLAGASVLAWPQFAPVSHMMSLVGQRLSLQVSATGSWSEGSTTSSNHYAYSGGTGASREVGLTVRSVRIPPTIHDLITVGGTTDDTEDLFTVADVDTSYVGVTQQHREESGSVAGSVTPTSLAATNGDTSIPTSGLRLLRCDASPSRKYSRIRVHAEVVDFADVPT